MTDHTSDKNRSHDLFKEECGFCQENLEAHALGILEPAGRARMELHLQWCGPCRREASSIRQATSLLGLASEPVAPSPSAKARLFERIQQESEANEPIVPFGNPWMPPATPAPANQNVVAASKASASRFGFASALVAPLAIALIVVGAWANSLRNDISDLQAQQQGNGVAANAETSVSEEQLRLYSMVPSCPECDDTPAAGHLGGNPEENVGILVAWNLNPNEQHQVWCEESDGEQVLISDLEVEQSGDVVQTVNFPEAIGGYQTIYVTRNDGTEEMRVALHEESPVDESTPQGGVPTGQ